LEAALDAARAAVVDFLFEDIVQERDVVAAVLVTASRDGYA
jgi:hypothetical protein